MVPHGNDEMMRIRQILPNDADTWDRLRYDPWPED
jgi:hypothetical protein